jgi:hypothetical protein
MPMTFSVMVTIAAMVSRFMKQGLQEGDSLSIFLREARYLK